MALRYVGKSPTSDAIIVPKGFADTTSTTLRVDENFVNAEIADQILVNDLRAPSYVTTQDNLRAHLSAVSAADANYLATTTLNAVNGVAGLDSSGNLFSAQVPSGVVTDRVFTTVTGTNILGSGAVQTVSTDNYRETAIATATVTDPGYPWYPLPFALVQGGSITGSTPASRTLGNGNYGLLAVVPPAGVSDTVYGAVVCNPIPHYNFYFLLPYAGSGRNPTALTGSLQLDLYASCYNGTGGYSFKGENMAYWVLVVPAIGG